MAAQSNKKIRQERRDAARAEVQRLREEQARRDRRNRTFMIGGIIAIVALAAIAAVAIIMTSNAKNAATDPTTLNPPTAAVAGYNNGYPIGSTLEAGSVNEGAVRVDLYSDYLCPGCGAYESALGSTLQQMAQDGDITYVLHPLANLDDLSNGTEYSSRTTEAAAIVAQYASDKLLAFHEGLFAQQPKENTDGLSDDQIAQIATDAGVPDDVVSKLTSGEFSEWVKATTRWAYQEERVESTPWLEINGERWTPSSIASNEDFVNQFTEAVDAAKSKASATK